MNAIRGADHEGTGPRVVAVTGAAGYLGQRVLPLLDAAPGIERIVGIDIHDPARRVRSLDFHRLDVTSADLKPALADVDTIVHLAALTAATTDATLLARINVEATNRVLETATAVGARRVVWASSAAVYGAWASNPIPLDERAALRPNPGFVPAAQDAESERRVLEWANSGVESRATILRIAPVVGPGTPSLFGRLLMDHAHVAVRGSNAPVQVVHADDAASAIAHVVISDLDGIYNVAADGWVEADAVRDLLPGRAAPSLPRGIAERAMRALWASGLSDIPPEVLPYVEAQWVIANDALRATGWTPKHTNEEAIVLSISPDRSYGALPWAAAVGAVLAGVGGATWALNRRRR